jgi:peptidoglycan/LPS O-acetylase OafA/YrhL
LDLFFVLSGYLIGGQLLRPLANGAKPSLGDFYLKRAFRILPAFWEVLAVYLLWPGFREAPGMESWWKFALFVVNPTSTTPRMPRSRTHGRCAWRNTST